MSQKNSETFAKKCIR